MSEYDWEEQRRMQAIITNITNGGGGGNLPKEHVELLMRSPVYLDAGHPLNAQLSKVVRDYYTINHSGDQHPLG